MWNFFVFILMIASPFFFFVMIMAAVNIGGVWLYEGLRGVLAIITFPVRLVMGKPNNKQHAIQSNVTYKIKRKKRPALCDKPYDKKRFPWNDPVLKRYYEANSTYPSVNSRRFKEGEKLNLNYFTSSSYPFDYIVMGDRLLIEETRKGDVLSQEEECWILLGFGYDGKPFGEPWGIEEECLSGFEYAQNEGDLLQWGEKSMYDEFISKGYTHKDHVRPVNYDRVEMAERKLREDLQNTQYERLTAEWLEAYRAERIAPARKVASGVSAVIQPLKA